VIKRAAWTAASSLEGASSYQALNFSALVSLEAGQINGKEKIVIVPITHFARRGGLYTCGILL
jgi:hypothetical protein